MAERRLASTERRLQNNDALREKYVSQINQYIHRGYSERVGPDEKCSKKFWYLPHHPVCSLNSIYYLFIYSFISVRQSITKLKIAFTETLINKRFYFSTHNQMSGRDQVSSSPEGTKGHRVSDICCRVCLIEMYSP